MHIPDFIHIAKNTFESELKKLTTLSFEIEILSTWAVRAFFPLDNTYLILITWDRYLTNERRAYLKSIINNKPTHYRNIYANFLHPKFDRWMSLFSQVKLPFADVILDIDIRATS